MDKVSITRESIQELLDKRNIPYKLSSIGDELTERLFEFTLNGIAYYIVWYINESYLSIGHRYANSRAFHKLEYDNCHPCYKDGLAFTSYKSNSFQDTTYVAIQLLSWQ